MRWFDRPAPVEPSHAERSVVTLPTCTACHGSGHDMTTVALPSYGDVPVCAHTTACIARAKTAGVWCEVGR